MIIGRDFLKVNNFVNVKMNYCKTVRDSSRSVKTFDLNLMDEIASFENDLDLSMNTMTKTM
jgi:hypothetical protein